MQQFAIASVKPRSIAWLIRIDEWDRLEEIIKYNCAMMGGYFNVIIPLTDQDTISKEYQHFLTSYDPDLIVLAPNMTGEQLNLSNLHSFGIVPWEMVSEIAFLDPLAGGGNANLTMSSQWIKIFFQEPKQFIQAFVAVANEANLDISRLALVACGETEPREPMWSVMDENIHLDATGYREHFLARFIKPGFDSKSVGAYFEEGIFPAPDRYELINIISDEYKFPMTDIINILEVSFRLQHDTKFYQSFIGLTATYKRIGTPERNAKSRKSADIVIMISDTFSMEEAILFWNLRANGSYVTWLPFSELENSTDQILQWLESDYTAVYFIGRSGIAFSSPHKDLARLETIIKELSNKRKYKFPWHIVPYSNLISYNYILPSIYKERVIVSKDNLNCSFIFKVPSEHLSGEYTVTLEWNGLMSPQNNSIVRNWISSEEVSNFAIGRRRENPNSVVKMPKFRITANRYLRTQVNAEEPVEFIRPTAEQIIETIFISAGFSRIVPSSTARYHKNFVDRAGSLDNVAHYLSGKPSRELLELLANDKKNRDKTGWIIDNPLRRRALHHFHLREVLGEVLPDKTKEYINTVSDQLPDIAVELLEKGILERGFRLKCNSCSFTSWYPAQQVGQTFKCTQCYQEQVYKINPLWLYKLAEVVFRGFEDNMQVPLLALNHLKNRSKHHFEWIPDSDVYWLEDNKELHQNIDLLCLSDGKLYIGEAKSSDEIEKEQFSFYERVCKQVEVDGIIFATSKSQWSRGTLQRIERLQAQFDGDILIFTEKDLYPGI